eukprot:14076705-Alexandrium_andersonii.AAC.1
MSAPGAPSASSAAGSPARNLGYDTVASEADVSEGTFGGTFNSIYERFPGRSGRVMRDLAGW